MLGAHYNVTEVMEERELLERCNEQAMIGHWYADLVKGTLFWSTEVKRILGVPPDYVPDVEGSFEFFDDAYKDKLASTFKHTSETGTPYDLTMRMVRLDGVKKWVRAVGIPKMMEGTCIAMYGTFQDINERVSRELERARTLKKVEGQNTRLQNFAHIVSHNLRSHVSGFEGVLNLVMEEKDEASKQSLLHMLQDGVMNLKTTLNDLQEVVQINIEEDMVKVWMPLKNEIQKVFESLKTVAEEAGLTLVNEVDSEQRVFAYPAYLRSVLLNFTTNAIKYLSPEKDSYFKVYVQNTSDKTVISFEDNGLGIDLDRHSKSIFNLFKTFHNHPDSRGVGLFITKNQVEMMGGNLSVKSTVHQGSTFIVELPFE
jgi:PAS domain S-box-containing protein